MLLFSLLIWNNQTTQLVDCLKLAWSKQKVYRKGQHAIEGLKLKKLILLTVGLLSSGAQAMNCANEFSWLKKTFEENDAGFSYVIDSKGEASYQNLNSQTIKKLDGVTDPKQCHEILKDWLFFFRKGHIALFLNTSSSSTVATEKTKNIFDMSSFKKRITALPADDLQGLWQFSDYTIALDKTGEEYVGYIVESDNPSWKPNDIKLKFILKDNTLSAIYYMGDRSQREISSVERYGNNAIILDDGFVAMRRLNPKEEDAQEVNRYVRLITANSPLFERVSSDTVLLRIPSFFHGQKQAIDRLIKENFKTIASTNNLIIDIRGNGGGSDASYSEILPLLYTNPIRNVGVEMLSTPLNNQRMVDYAEGEEYPQEIRNWAKASIDKLNANEGKFVQLEKERVTVEQFDAVLPQPAQVAILIDKNNGSSAEQFLLAAKQSKKVKLFGTTTTGVLDISNIHQVNSPSGNLTLYYSLSRSFRIPDMTIDGIGLQPDYFIDSSVPKYQWVDFTTDVLEYQ